MANIQTNNKSKNSNKQPKGTMPMDKLKQYKLLCNLRDPVSYVTRDTKKIAQSARAISTYRMIVHGVNTHRLPSSLRSTVHYFQVPMSRSDSDNSRDSRGVESTETTSV
jgi:hypothetical protein